MLLTLSSFLLAPLFVFGIYHLLTWFNVARINKRVFWKRVAIASAVCHVLLASGFLAFSYIDAKGADFGIYLFNRSNFWKLMTIFDTVPMLVILGFFTALDRAGMNPPGLVFMTLGITYIVGTLQW